MRCSSRLVLRACVPGHRWRLVLDPAGERDDRPRARRSGRRRAGVRSATRAPRRVGSRCSRMAMRRVHAQLAAAVAVTLRDRLIVGLVDRPPHDPEDPGDRDLEDQHQPDEGPCHARSRDGTTRHARWRTLPAARSIRATGCMHPVVGRAHAPARGAAHAPPRTTGTRLSRAARSGRRGSASRVPARARARRSPLRSGEPRARCRTLRR